jgi:hypothetical protein
MSSVSVLKGQLTGQVSKALTGFPLTIAQSLQVLTTAPAARRGRAELSFSFGEIRQEKGNG